MAVEVNFPKPGMGIDEGTVVRWLKGVGDEVALGETIAEIETAKATVEIESPASGVLSQILVDEGATALVNTCLAILE